jgi:hypothetical protein
MTDYKATAEEWRKIENSQVFNATFQKCVLELRSRVEKLEMGAGIRDIVAKELQNSPLVEPKKSLTQRVHSCIVGEPECGHMQARAVIREVAHWMREQEGDYSMIRWLEMEIDE